MANKIAKRTGRPKSATIDAEKAAIVLRCLLVGNYLDTSARIAGLSPGKVRDWLAWGEQGRAPEFVDFYNAVKEAEAHAEALYLSLVFEAARDRGIWQAAAWYLERKNPTRWGKVEKVEMDVSGSLKVQRQKEVEQVLANYSEVIEEAERLLTEPFGDNGSGE